MSSRARPFSAAAAFVFALVALGHVLRVALGWEVVVDGFTVPFSVSVVAAAVAGGLSLMVLRELR